MEEQKKTESTASEQWIEELLSTCPPADTSTEKVPFAPTAEPGDGDSAANESADDTTADSAEPVADTAGDDPLAHAFEYYAPEQKAPRRWPIVLLAGLLTVVFAVGILWAFDIIKLPESLQKNPQPDDIKIAEIKDLPAAQSANFTVTNAMFAYDMESIYQNFKTYYGYYLSAINLDTTQSLKEQTSQMTGDTWFNYFADSARNEIEQLLVLAEGGRAAGLTLTDEDYAQIDEQMAELDLSSFKSGLTEQDARAFWEMYLMAVKQNQTMYNSYTFTDADITKQYDDNPLQYQQCDYVTVTLAIGENADFASAEEAAATLETFTSAKNAAAFKKAVCNWLVKSGNCESADEAAETYEDECVVTGAAYQESNAALAWLFAADTLPETTYTASSQDSITVYMLTKSPYRNTAKEVNVRHILFTADTYGSDDAAKAKAEEIYRQWQDGEATEDSFAALATAYTEDTNKDEGGLYEGVSEGYMVANFNDWCFDDTRKTGDTGVVQTSYGYHILYYVGDAETWYNDAADDLRAAAYQADYEALEAAYPVTFLDDNILQLPL